MLPEVKEHLESVRAAYREVARHRAAVTLRAHGNGGDPHGSGWAEWSAVLDEELKWFDGRSIMLKDIELGLVDFPAQIEGQEALLCWKDGEPEVAFWHTPDGGFAGRQPL